jgi:hypothetical protein
MPDVSSATRRLEAEIMVQRTIILQYGLPTTADSSRFLAAYFRIIKMLLSTELIL